MTHNDLLNWTLQTGLAITLLIGFILVIRRPVAQRFGAGAAYSLWLLPFIRLFLPAMNIPLIKTKTEAPLPGPIVSLPAPSFEGPQTVLTAPNSVPWAALLLGLWALIAAAWLCREILRQRKYARILRAQSRPLTGPLVLLAGKAQRAIGLKALPDIRVSSVQSGPLVTGLFRPLIILPTNFETHFHPQQQYFALLHEMAHIRRKDLWAASVVLVFRTLNWPNPLVHFGARKFRADQEAACDATVLKLIGQAAHTRHAYAETLVHAAKTVLRPTYDAPLNLTIYHPLKERLMMMTHKTKRTGRLAKAAFGTLLLSAAALTAPISLAGGPKDDTLAGEHKAKDKSVQVIKWKQSGDVPTAEKHFEIITEDGVTKAYSIDKDGKKTEIDPETIETEPHILRMKKIGTDGQKLSVIMTGDDDGEMKKRIEIITGKEFRPMDGEHENFTIETIDGEGGQKNVQVYSYGTTKVIDIDTDGDHAFIEQGAHAKAVVGAASGLLEGVDESKLSDKSKSKLEKARKALKEAQAAIDSEK